MFVRKIGVQERGQAVARDAVQGRRALRSKQWRHTSKRGSRKCRHEEQKKQRKAEGVGLGRAHVSGKANKKV